MTDTERLEEIKKSFQNTLLMLGRSNGKTQLFKDINWLFEQAEKAEQLKKENKRLQRAVGKYSGELQEVFEKQQNLYRSGLDITRRMLRDE